METVDRGEDSNEGSFNEFSMPQKKYFRQRAHVNPIADHSFDYPLSPNDVDWNKHFIIAKDSLPESRVRYLDVGCGYGGLLIALSPIMDGNDLALGMEIRSKVSEYVQKRILALRSQEPGKYNNIWCLRTNAMRFIPNHIKKGQLTKMFFLFPDPHFKPSKHKWRIINRCLLDEYAYVCAIGAIVYIATDVEDLYSWMCSNLQSHPLFKQIPQEDIDKDPVVKLIISSTEESRKVERNHGPKLYTAFSRIE